MGFVEATLASDSGSFAFKQSFDQIQGVADNNQKNDDCAYCNDSAHGCFPQAVKATF
jgi:hypothetical protein